MAMTNAAGRGWGCRQVPVSEGGCSEMRRAMRQRKMGSHTPPCHRRMVITTLFSVMLAALQRCGGGGGWSPCPPFAQNATQPNRRPHPLCCLVCATGT